MGRPVDLSTKAYFHNPHPGSVSVGHDGVRSHEELILHRDQSLFIVWADELVFLLFTVGWEMKDGTRPPGTVAYGNQAMAGGRRWSI
jgi:hypothetical protein